MPISFRRALGAGCSSLILPLNLVAQEARPIEELIVTGRTNGYAASDALSATKTSTPIKEIPQSIQVLTADLLANQDLQNLSDALVNVSGIAPADDTEGLLANFFIRGFAATIFYDGLPAFGQTNVVDPNSLVGVERVEVVKGPTGTLFGGGIGAPLGGIINVVSKSPEADAAYELGLRGGSFGTINPFVDINQPLIEDTLLLRISAEYERANSFIDVVESERVAIFPTLAWLPTDDTSVVLRGQYSRNEFIEFSGLPATGTIVEAPFEIPRFRFPGATDVPDNVNTNALITGEIRHRFTEGLNASVAVRYLDSEFTEFSTFLSPFFAPFFGASVDPTDPVQPLLAGVLPTDTEEFNVNANLTWEGATGAIEHVLLGGFEFDRTNNVATTFFTLNGEIDISDPASDIPFAQFPIPPLDATAGQNNRFTTFAGYIQDQITVFDRLHILLSGRVTSIESEELAIGQTVTDTRFTGRAGITYDLTQQVSAFFGFGEGFQAVLNFFGADLPIPEETTQFEGGLKFDFTDWGLSGTIAGYHIERRNVAVSDPVTFLSVQLGEQTSTGAELDLIWQPIPAFSLIANYAYTDAINATEDDLSFGFPITAGDRLSRIPLHSGRVAMNYEFLDGVAEGLSFGIGLTAASERELTLGNSFAAPAFYTVDLQVAYERGPYSLTVAVQNLADREFFEPHQFLLQDVVRPAQPISAFATLRARF